MNRTEELRQELIADIGQAITQFEDYNRGDLDKMERVCISEVTAKRTVELLKKLEAPVEAVWRYHNDEHGQWWDCSACGKICRKNPHEKLGCSRCRAKMRMEA